MTVAVHVNLAEVISGCGVIMMYQFYHNDIHGATFPVRQGERDYSQDPPTILC